MRAVAAAVLLTAYFIAVSWTPPPIALAVVVVAGAVVLFGLTSYLERRS